MNFVHDRPAFYLPGPKEAVNQSDGAMVRACPAIGEKACVVKNHDATGLDERAPIVPVLLNSGIRVVAINENEVERCYPFADSVEAEFFDPRDSCARATFDRRTSCPLGKVEHWETTKVEWINQVERSIGRHVLAQSERRSEE